MTLGITGDIALILIAAFFGGLAAHYLRVPLLLGYMAAGVLVGPHTAGPTVGNVHDIELLADVGVALMLFTLGLEFPLRKLAEVGRVALLGTPLQLSITVLMGYGIARGMGWQWREAIWFGAMLSFSSTMVVMKVLIGRGTLESLSGRVMVGILIVQDLALLPMLVLLPALDSPNQMLGSIAWSLLKAGGFVAGMLLLGSRVFPIMTRRIARLDSKELFQIWVAALGLGVGYLTYQIGLSFAFGAFMTGMVLSESDYSHQAESDIAPLRELFIMLFFASVGMLLQPAFLLQNCGRICVVVALVVAGKALLFSGLVRLFGYTAADSVAVGLGLSQIGEFSFVLARFGIQSKAITDDMYGIVLSTTVATMILTPLLFSLSRPLSSLLRGTGDAVTLEPVALQAAGQVIVGGFGRVGRTVAREVQAAGKPLIVIEAHPDRVHEARDANLPILFGDAASRALLEAARVRDAALLVLTMTDAVSINLAVQRARQLNPDLPIICRAINLSHLRELATMDVQSAIQPEMEGAIEMIAVVLTMLEVPRAEIDDRATQLRARHYGPLLQSSDLQ